jgi:glycosyltransferase involved in cell wall biosynthesis
VYLIFPACATEEAIADDQTVHNQRVQPPATRVLRIISRLNVGGPAKHVLALHQGLTANGFESLLVTGTVAPGEADMAGDALALGVTPLVIPEMGRELALRDALIVWRLWRLMVAFHPDFVHTHTSKAGALGRVAGLLYRFGTPGTLVGRPRRCLFVHTYHGHIFHSYFGALRTRLFLGIDRILARVNTDRIVVLGPQQLREILDRFGVGRSSQFAIVPLGIDFAPLAADAAMRERVRSALGFDRAEPIVGIVARLTAIKNHELFLRVAARSGGPARFVVYGDGPDRQRLERRATELGLGRRVVFAGLWKPEEIYASLDVAALTSRNEGTPLSLIEAMATGKPVISTAVGGVVDLLGQPEERVVTDAGSFEIRERGIAVAPDDEAGFAAGLTRLLADEPLRLRLAGRARAYVERSHTESRLVADIMRLYREVAAQAS